MSDKSKLCPFCGSDDTAIDGIVNSRRFMRCNNCLATGPSHPHAMDALVNLWNHRPIEDAPTAENERLRETDLQEYMNAHAEWADVKFKGQSLSGVLAHLKKEIAEWAATPGDPEEFADVFSLTMRGWHLLGGTADTAIEAAYRKLEICKTRTYGDPDKDGSVQHIKETP